MSEENSKYNHDEKTINEEDIYFIFNFLKHAVEKHKQKEALYYGVPSDEGTITYVGGIPINERRYRCPDCGRAVKGERGEHVFCSWCGQHIYIPLEEEEDWRRKDIPLEKVDEW